VKNFINYKSFIAKTQFGLENVLAGELEKYGAKNIKIMNRAVGFEGNKELLYTANLSLRTALRILVPLSSFNISNAGNLYKKTFAVNWVKFINPNKTFMIESVVNSKLFKHSKFPSLKVKDAIVDKIRESRGKRPNINTVEPDIKIHLHIQNNSCRIFLDSSGESLHKRGYRLEGFTAPLNETLAAGMILLTGWNGDSNFIDPMCGSGTLVIEAAMIAMNIAPNLNRNNLGFMKWKDFDNELFNNVKNKLTENQKELKIKIYGSDKSSKAVNIAKKNAQRAGLSNKIILERKNFTDVDKIGGNGLIVTNPPYGERIKERNLNNLYKNFGDVLKQKFTGYDAWILSSDKEAMKNIGLKTSKRLTLFNGALECKFYNYKLFKGPLKKSKTAQ